jgi:PTS system mannose-specific IIA component
MVGLILFSHSGLAEAFREVLQAVAGPQEQLVALGLGPEISVEQQERRLEEAIPVVDDGDGVVIVTDLFGGSPANTSLARMRPGKVEVVSGLNLAMLLKALDLRNHRISSPVEMARAMVREGRENIVQASEFLESNPDREST